MQEGIESSVPESFSKFYIFYLTLTWDAIKQYKLLYLKRCNLKKITVKLQNLNQLFNIYALNSNKNDTLNLYNIKYMI